MGNRPHIVDKTTYRATAEDIDNGLAIADAMRRQGFADFPTRSTALRFALRATANHLRRHGRLPADA